ncbi:hypothetical protein [Bacillus alveayuensis]|jgi:hypothetical protein|uniref:hypothetical protein n=1 Tax=Aeribacillus alveayuensis TaxID=279215 RepID=UPI000A8054B2|nr:hypothetical protein [Bacillus alveayuensis]
MEDFNDYVKEMEKASKMGANEDIIHVSKNDDGYDLRDGGTIGAKQSIDKIDNA